MFEYMCTFYSLLAKRPVHSPATYWKNWFPSRECWCMCAENNRAANKQHSRNCTTHSRCGGITITPTIISLTTTLPHHHTTIPPWILSSTSIQMRQRTAHWLSCAALQTYICTQIYIFIYSYTHSNPSITQA